ncbi:MAG: tRNA (guanosine(37)-N1)-methyltransferase TrmD [Cyanobacteria bacterium MAG CAR4_bin_6]|nr:tRNA (guanosine(37)-N1)-methyltransferase TrmD [Cyanobacteria bacterium MAG CAR4_bin_6]MCY4234934.1 tRNA (guanosine(37)-N1)-methyltransferase TrmD [Cyanobacteria bacterium MAG CAR2_bin_4]MCY4331300.1 tRNA (guanosine(37)-N1)-methyltransferase TrmD [Cyanobacteria bacterium MAG CAR1_bin_15]
MEERQPQAPLRLDVVSLFPQAFHMLYGLGVIGRAFTAGLAELYTHNPRDFAPGPYHKVDDSPYGGGAGMVLKPEPVFAAVESIPAGHGRRVLLMCPQGRPFRQADAQRLAANHDQLVIVCGHYEGIDERIRSLADEELCVGDVVLTGGEIPAMAVINAVLRLRRGTVGRAESLRQESFCQGLLEYPHYTRPRVFRGMEAPAVLCSGDHGAVDRWRQAQREQRTRQRRPELLRPRPGP